MINDKNLPVYIPTSIVKFNPGQGQELILRGLESLQVSAIKPKILIVDDEAALRQLLEQFIRKDFSNEISEVTITDNGLSAMSLLKTEKYDIIITDLRHPCPDGLELVKTVTETYKKLIIIVHSGFLNSGAGKEALKYKCFAYLDKPCTVEMIRDTIRKAIKTVSNSGAVKKEGKKGTG